jgi:hypothetical protein
MVFETEPSTSGVNPPGFEGKSLGRISSRLQAMKCL